MVYRDTLLYNEGVEGDIVGIKGVSRHHGGFMGIRGDSRGILGCLLASRRIYGDIKVSPGITTDLWGYQGVSWHHGGFMRIQGDSKVSPGITADL